MDNSQKNEHLSPDQEIAKKIELATQAYRHTLERLTGRKVMVATIALGPDKRTEANVTMPTTVHPNEVISLARQLSTTMFDFALRLQATTITQQTAGKPAIITQNS